MMEIPMELATRCCGKHVVRRKRSRGSLCFLILLVIVWTPCSSFALQRHDLAPEASGQAAGEDKSIASSHGKEEQPPSPGGHGAGVQGGAPGQAMSPQESGPGHETPKGGDTHKPAAAGQAHPPATGKDAGTSHGAAAEHATAGDGHAVHGPLLPEISPTPGVTFVETMIKLMDYELNGRFFGWRPNDILVGQLTDNVNNFQLGVLEAIRFTTLRLKDSLTRMGDADTYDPDLEAALNFFMNSSTKFWFPSAEDSYGNAIDHLKRFVEKLKTGKRNFYYRKDNLVLLISTYKDLLGNVNKSLVAPMDWFKSDDAFYYAKGVAHVYYEILRVVRKGFERQLGTTLYAQEILDEVIHELYRAEEADPWIVLDGDLGGFLANHRANLNAPLSEVAHLLVILSQF